MMYRLWIAMEDQRVEHFSALLRKWAVMAGCLFACAFLIYRSSVSHIASDSITVSLFCGVTSLLFLLTAVGVALQQQDQPPRRK